MAITKCINSESNQYKPVLTDKLVLDAVPTVNSLNGVTSDAVARAIAGASGEVPQVTENDNGKVLTAIYDEGGAAVEWAEAQGGDVDQTYDATSTNAQSGVAVAQAIAAIPSEVLTASGYFELGGTNPVKVNYTGTPERSITDTPLAVSDLSNFHINPSYVSTFQVFFTNPAGGLRSLDTNTATLKVKVNSILAACNAPSSAYVTRSSGIMYGMNSGNFGGPFMNGSITISAQNDISEQTVTLSGVNQALGACGDYIDVDFSISFNSSEDADTCSQALIEAIQNGEIFEIDWPVVSESGKTLTTIPNIPASTSADENKVLTVNAQGAPAWSNVPQELPSVTGNAGKVLTVNSGATGVEWVTPSGGGSSYTAGDGIDITSDTISADLDPKGLKITSGKVDINLATNSGLAYAQQQATSSLTVGGGTGSTYNGTIRFNVSDLNDYLDSATSGQTFTLTIPANLFAAEIPMYPGDTILFVFSNLPATAGSSGTTRSYIDVTDQISYTSDPDEMTTTINACTITLPAYLYSSAGWSSDVAAHNFGYFAITDPSMHFNSGSGSVTASYTGSPSGLKVLNPIQLVSALPANPDANTLYLIPEA